MLRRLVVLCTIPFALLVFPSIASAHHASISASVDCSGLVSFTATSWATPDADHRINNSVSVTVNGAAAASGAFNAGNGYALSGTFQLASPLPPSATATVTYGNFGAAGEYGSASTASSGAVTVPACPAAPGGTIGDVDCGAGGALVTLSNTGGLAADISIVRDGVTVGTVTVAGGGTANRLVTIAEDTTSTIALVSGGATLASRSVSANCIVPPAAPTGSIGDVSCADGGAYATLTNTAVGGADATFTITVNGTLLDTVAVAGGATVLRLVPIAEDATAAIAVASGAFAVDRSLTLDCVAPAAPGGSVGDVSCANGGSVATLANTGGATATSTISVNGSLVDTVPVAGGTTVYRLVPIAQDTTATTSLTSGAFTTSRTLTLDCVAAPAPTLPSSVDVTATPATTPVANTTFPGNGPSVIAANDSNTLLPVVDLTPTAAAAAPSTTALVQTASTTELPFTGAPRTTPIILLALGLIGAGSLLIGSMRHSRLRRTRALALDAND